ncbi:MAG TPA: ribosome biogenesis GTPase Der [Eubacteriales bacterium]|nr:ribosome biogenesis GTPase Der [Eubacteriales bacterium]
MKPLVAIVGKPNVGKSTFFNKVAGSRISIVLNTPGVTRDRIYADAYWLGREFTMVDTGGIQLKSDDEMHSHIIKQAQLAMDVADVILFIVDGKNGLTADDSDVAQLLRKTKKPTILVVNKIDDFSVVDLSDFYSLGMGEPIPVSAEQKKGIGDVLDEVISYFPDIEEQQSESDGIKVAVVGKPNVGKSSLVNRLLGYDRAIVSGVSGTTRDAIDTEIEANGKKYTLIDTAGIRRRRSIEDDSVESYSVMRSLAAVRRADVCLLVLDAAEEISEQDVRLAGYAHEEGKPSVIVLNKWDLIEKDTHTVENYNKKLNADLAFMDYFVSVTVSALSGQRVNKLWELIDYVYEKSTFRATTGILNEIVADAVAAVEPPSQNGKRLKIRYCTQPSTQPPTFVLFVNDPKIMHFSYKRYLTNFIRKAFDLKGTPIRLVVRGNDEKE